MKGKKKIFIVIAILILFVITIIIHCFYNYNLIQKFNSFSLENLSPIYIKEERKYIIEEVPQMGQNIGYTGYGPIYYTASISKYKETNHYILNGTNIYFNNGDKFINVVYQNGEESIQEAKDFDDIVELYSTYLNWNSKNIFEKIDYILMAKIKKGKFNDSPIYYISYNNETWLIDAVNYYPISFKDLNLYISKQYDYTEHLEFSEIFEKYYGKNTYKKLHDRMAEEIVITNENDIVIFNDLQKNEVNMVIDLVKRNKVTTTERETLIDWLKGINPENLNDEELQTKINNL